MRRAELRVDPAKVRSWIDRSRLKAAERARERPGKQLSRKRRQRPQEGPLTPVEWFLQVAERSHWRCCVTRAKATSRFDRRFEAHHVIPKQLLRRHGLHMKVYDPRNGMFIAQRVHMLHEQAVERIPRSAIPSSAYAFAAECGSWAEAYLERTYC